MTVLREKSSFKSVKIELFIHLVSNKEIFTVKELLDIFNFELVFYKRVPSIRWSIVAFYVHLVEPLKTCYSIAQTHACSLIFTCFYCISHCNTIEKIDLTYATFPIKIDWIISQLSTPVHIAKVCPQTNKQFV